MRITVTKDCIKHGRVQSLSECPVALAFSDYFPNEEIEVDRDTWKIIGSDRSFKLSRATMRFIDRFDEGRPVRPFSFTI